MIKNYFATINETKTETKKVILLEIITAACLGLVIGMLISPRKNVMIGSKNKGNGCNNNAPAKEKEE
uniref:hypothetical protein n=1 Tax=Eubacterium cellulosolvens TaxID=29322 RepID=UPI0005587A7F|nr:hypothetical protein [[Eubacterium] cellulosolvens]